jgi:hypothetical protein
LLARTRRPGKERAVREAAEQDAVELAQAREIDLWREVLERIANGAEDAPGLARLALRTQEIDFDRLIGPADEYQGGSLKVTLELDVTGTVEIRRWLKPSG